MQFCAGPSPVFGWQVAQERAEETVKYFLETLAGKLLRKELRKLWNISSATSLPLTFVTE